MRRNIHIENYLQVVGAGFIFPDILGQTIKHVQFQEIKIKLGLKCTVLQIDIDFLFRG